MGEIGIYTEMHFCGQCGQASMLRELLLLMTTGKNDEESYYKESIQVNGNTLTLNDNWEGIYYNNGLLGKLNYKRQNGMQWGYPDEDLTKAPRYFAALFPKADFKYLCCVEYGSIEGLEAVYKEGKLALYKLWNSDREIRDFIKENMSLFSGVEGINDLMNNKMPDDDLLNDDIKGIAIDKVCQIMNTDNWLEGLMLYRGSETVIPYRDQDYEKSFFDGDDLLVYLLGRLIEQDNEEAVGAYVDRLSLQQIKKLISSSAGNNSTGSMAILLDAKYRNYSKSRNNLQNSILD